MFTSGHKLGILAALLLILGLAHLVSYPRTEPFYNHDESRHVMTGVYVRDALLDGAVFHLRSYTVRYYLQYPALGLLAWPPFFYCVEGVAMILFGPSFLVGQVLVGLFGVMACTYLFLLACRTHDLFTASLAVLLFGFAPQVFAFTQLVMLEVPALALSLMAVYHLHRYLESERRRDLYLCCLATALTALTRYEGVFLAPLFLIWLAGRRRLSLLLRPRVIAGVLGAVLLVAPFHYLAAREFGKAIFHAVAAGTNDTSVGFLAPSSFVYYPACIPEQIGWLAVPPALLGLFVALGPKRRAASWPYLALTAAVYLTVVPMGEREPRHAIFWVPALAVFAADGLLVLAAFWQRCWAGKGEALTGWRDAGGDLTAPARVLLTGAVVVGWAQAVAQPFGYVRGYEEAARYVLENTHESSACLFDNYLNGDFIYQMRRLDPERRLWVLRGDKVFYGVQSDPHVAYVEWVRGEADVLKLVTRYDPELLVVEQPQIRDVLPAAETLRRTLREHGERFRLEKVIPIESNVRKYVGKELYVYRNLERNPDRDRDLKVEMLGLGTSIQTEMP
jgi:4-amino-4-deoxy-L-arabinose transferase-like glycosyltransferase